MFRKSLALSALFTVLAASAAIAVDEGNTKPKLDSAGVNWSVASADAINQTSVSGNIKGVSCHFDATTAATGWGTVVFTVNGGTAQTIYVYAYDYQADNSGNVWTGWIPMNIRFSSSIRVQVQRGSGQFACTVSWALD